MNDQLILFQSPAPEKTYGQTQHDRMYEKATSPEVIEAMIDVFRAHRGEFIRFHVECWDIWQRYDLGSYINDSLHYMIRRGILEEDRRYYGATSPSAAPKTKARGKQAALEKPYIGYECLYRLKESA